MDERALMRGLIVNRFRGDPALFIDGVTILEQRSRLPVLGVVPWLRDLGIAEEDAVALERRRYMPTAGELSIAVLNLPFVANFDDLDPLANEPGVVVRFIDHPDELAEVAAIILPGTKHTLAARRWLRQKGWDDALRHFRGSIVGICGGYQLLGETIADPAALEGSGGTVAGLGLLPVTTLFQPDKQTARVVARLHDPSWGQDAMDGYEIHMGRTHRLRDATPFLRIERRGDRRDEHDDGCISDDRRIWGCYLHGLWVNQGLRHGWLRSLGWRPQKREPIPDPYARLATIVEANLDPALLASLLRC
ncbi:MAG: hypothetical protein NVSMB42_21510 [Herpetosiphon sp.]